MAVQLAGKPGVGLADLIAKQLSPKPDDQGEEKLQASDYLNRALAAGGQHVGKPSEPQVRQSPNTLKPSTLQPLDESGLSALQESLARLEQSQLSLDEQWQQMQAEIDGGTGANKQLFMSQLLPHAQEAADALGVDANVLLAQAALETGWGKSVIKNGQGESSFNLFNIKADKSWQGKQASVSTVEYDGNVARKEMAGFRSYESYKQSFDDYVNFIKTNPRYSEALKKAGNPTLYVRELQKAGYATDPRYAEKIMRIYNSRIAGRATLDAG
jgi:peptidoglycan hydrolase FlgJ